MPSPTPDRPWLGWYGRKRWVDRARQQMRNHPLCVMCLQQGIVRAASVADHIKPHRGDYKQFWFGELQSLCAPCHSSSKQQLESKGFVNDIGEDGFPKDKNHPFFKSNK